jgi:hypothetical protein
MLKGEGEDNEVSVAPESTVFPTTRDILLPEWAEDEKCITGECVHYTCEMRQEDPIEEPIEVQRTTEYTNDWTQVSGRRKVGTAKRSEPPPDPVTTRKIPDSNTWAKPLRSDTRHTIRLRPSIDGYDELTVFAPPEICRTQIMLAIKPEWDKPPNFNWDYVRPTSFSYRKWVYYPKEHHEE